jgi:DNA-binding Lrp family transcriptional regulator
MSPLPPLSAAPAAPPRPIDDLDQRIIDALRLQPRQAIKDLAAELNASEPTITARIRAMDTDGVMRIAAQRDFRAAGFDVLASVDLGVRGRPLNDVARDVAALEGVAIVTLAMGDRPLMLLVMAATLDELYQVTLRQLADIEGVSSMDTMIISEVMKYRSDYAALAPRSAT